MELEPIDAQRGGHRDGPRDAGADAGRVRAVRAGRRAARRPRSRTVLERLASLKRARRPAPRRGDPLPPPRRLLRQRHGRLGGAGGRDPRDRQADGGVPRHLALLPAPDLRRLALLRLHDGPRALEGGVRRDPRLDRRRHRDRASARRSTRAPSSRRCGCSTSPTRSSAGKRSTRADHLALRHALGGALQPGRRASCRAASTRPCARCARSAATRSSSSAPTAPRSSTSTATSTSTTSARGAR